MVNLRKKHTKRVLELFYRTNLRKEEEIIDNMDSTIAKEVGIKIGVVNYILGLEMKEKVKMAGKNLSNEDKDIEEMEVEYELIT